jgi:glycerol-3-phosphate cytidylyltransferase
MEKDTMKVGFICSTWDLLHPGHLYTLSKCKQNCDYLIVGLHVKGRNKKLAETVLERYSRLKACKWVDQIIPYETEDDLENILCTSNIDVRFLGEDYIGRDDITGKDLVNIQYISRTHDWSSTALKERIKKL